MSDIQEKLDAFQLKLAKMQFRTSKKQRYRIYRKLEGMLKGNEALSRSLDRLYQNVTEMGKYPKRPAAYALRDWFLKDRTGMPLARAMEGWVPDGELYLIRAGEESGSLAKTLGSIQEMGKRGSQMKQAVFQAVAYPVAMFMLVCFVIYTFGINMIKQMRENAPARVVDAMGSLVPFSDFIAAWGLYVVLLVIVLSTLIVLSLSKWKGGLRPKFDLYPPWSWYRVLQGSSFLLGLSALLGAQMPLKRSLEILEEQGSPWIRLRIGLLRQEVLRGRNLGEAMRIVRMNFPDPLVAVDLEILSERADVGAVIEDVTEEWITDQIDSMRIQALVIRNVGMAIVGGMISWVMMSIFGVVGEISKPGGMGQ